MNLEAAATYVNIDRDEFESWLDSVTKTWSRKSGTQGVYLIHLSKTVAVEVQSSLSSQSTNMGRGNASMKLRLMSTVTGQTLNKKAQGQGYFTRTQNWKANLTKGVDKLKQAYLKARGFYEAVAEIEDRAQYKQDLLTLIESIPSWPKNTILVDFHNKIEGDGVLTQKQVALIDKIKADAPVQDESSKSRRPQELTMKQREFLQRLEKLTEVASDAGDNWTAQFAYDLGGKLGTGTYKLSDKQRALLIRKLKQYNV